MVSLMLCDGIYLVFDVLLLGYLGDVLDMCLFNVLLLFEVCVYIEW